MTRSRPSLRRIAPVIPAAVALLAAGATASAQPAPRPDDVASPEAIVLATYASIQRAPGQHYDWDRFRSLFLPGALLIPNTEQRGGAFTPLSVQGFIDWIDAATTVGGADDLGFAEAQVSFTLQRYGDVAQVFSTYDKHFWDDDRSLGRGINSFQLVHDGARWWIAGVAWDEENGAGPIPERYRGGR